VWHALMFFQLNRLCLLIFPCFLSVNLAVALFYAATVSARVSFDPRISTALNYTDNIRLTDSGTEQAERVFEVAPGFLLDAQSKYISAFLDYDLVFYRYKNLPESNTYLNKFNGALIAELVPETFFLDANINNSQRTINSTGVVPINDFTLTNNRADVFSFSVSPYFKQRYGNFSIFQARYTYDRTRYSTNDDTTIPGRDPSGYNNRVWLDLNSGPRFVRGKWNLAYNFRQFNNTPQQGSITTGIYHDLVLGGSYQLGARISGLASVGYEYKDTRNRTNIQKGPTRSIGASWNPSRRFLMSATFGKRFYGNAISMLINYRRRLSIFDLKYTEDVTNNVGVVTQGNIDANQQAPGSSGLPNDIPFPTLDATVFIKKRLTARYDYNAKRATFNLVAYNELRDYEDEERKDQKIFGGVGIFAYNFGRLSYFSIEGNWSKTFFNDAIAGDNVNNIDAKDERIDNIWKGVVSINKNLSSSSTAKLAYSYIKRLSNERGHDYRQNVITANIIIVFDKL